MGYKRAYTVQMLRLGVLGGGMKRRGRKMAEQKKKKKQEHTAVELLAEWNVTYKYTVVDKRSALHSRLEEKYSLLMTL